MTVQQISAERWRLGPLYAELHTAEQCLQWATKRRLLHNSVDCPQCRRPASLVARTEMSDGYCWRCATATCNFTKAVRADSFFQNSHLHMKQIVLMMYCWACDMPQTAIAHEADVPEGSTVIDWCSFFRDEAENYVERNSGEIGGMDVNGEPLTVEIDETQFFHRRYQRGQWREGHWVFGGIERGSGKCFLVEVPDRQAQTIERKIREHILPGTIIVSDGSAAYANIHAIGGWNLHSRRGSARPPVC